VAQSEVTRFALCAAQWRSPRTAGARKRPHPLSELWLSASTPHATKSPDTQRDLAAAAPVPLASQRRMRHRAGCKACSPQFFEAGSASISAPIRAKDLFGCCQWSFPTTNRRAISAVSDRYGLGTVRDCTPWRSCSGKVSVAHLPRWKRADVSCWRTGREAGYLATATSMAGFMPKMLAAGGPHQAKNGNSGARIRSAPARSTDLKGKPTLQSDPAVRRSELNDRAICLMYKNTPTVSVKDKPRVRRDVDAARRRERLGDSDWRTRRSGASGSVSITSWHRWYRAGRTASSRPRSRTAWRGLARSGQD